MAKSFDYLHKVKLLVELLLTIQSPLVLARSHRSRLWLAAQTAIAEFTPATEKVEARYLVPVVEIALVPKAEYRLRFNDGCKHFVVVLLLLLYYFFLLDLRFASCFRTQIVKEFLGHKSRRRYHAFVNFTWSYLVATSFKAFEIRLLRQL